MPELRHDPLTDMFVIVAPERGARPQAASSVVPAAPAFAQTCPFCPGHEASTPPEVARTGEPSPDAPGWRIRVFPNLYPIVGGRDASPGATGAHEVIVLSPAHHRSFARLDPESAAEVLMVLRDRVVHHLEAGRAFVQVLINHGDAAGASLPHPHAQLVALDLVPPAVRHLVARFEGAGSDLVATAVDEAGDRAVRDGAATVWCPEASGAPFTFRVAHDASRGRFEHATDAEIRAVAEASRDALARLELVLGDVPYNLVVHAAPPADGERFHWYVEVTPRIAQVAGFEIGTGILVNTVAPEQAAAMLREADAR